VIPKGEYVSVDDFSQNAPAAELAAFIRAIGRIAREEGVAETGWRFVFNNGRDAGQSVFHVHGHVLGGRALTSGAG